MKTLFVLPALLFGFGAVQDPAALVEQLGADDIVARDRAFAELEKLGAAAEPALRKAATSRDAAVALHAGRLLRILELDRVLSPAMKKAFPGICRRVGRGAGDESTKIYLEVASARPDEHGSKPHAELTRADLEPLALAAVRNASTEEDKIAACEAAALWFHTSAEPAVLELLRDAGGSVRRAACNALIALVGRAALAKILEHLKGQPLLMVHCIHGFDARTAYEARASLMDLLRHPDGEVVAAAVGALQELEVPGLVPVIRGLLKSKSVHAKGAALDYFRTFQWDEAGVREFADDVKSLLDDSDPALRGAAAEVLWKSDASVPPAAALRLFGEAESKHFSEALRVVPKSAGKDPALLESIRKLLQHSDKDVVPYAFFALKRLEDPRIDEISMGFATHESAWLQLEAVNTLGESKSPRALEFLRKSLLDATGDVYFRLAAFQKLAELKSLPPKEDLEPVLKGKDVAIAALVARHLADSAPDLVREEVPRLLLDEFSRHVSGVWDLAKLMTRDARVPLLLKALEIGAESRGDARAAIIEHKEDGYIPGLQTLLSNERPAVQAAAIEILGDLDAVEARPEILKLLSSPDPEVRGAAVEALQDFGIGSDAGEVRRMTADPITRVRRSALAALKRHGVKDAIPEFVKLLDDPDSDAASDAAEALVELGSRDLVPKMVEWLGRPEDTWRSGSAAHALAVIEPEAATAVVLALLDHREADARRKGAQHLQMFNLRQHARLLLPLLAESEIAEDAVQAIIALDAKDLIPDLEALLADPSSVRRSAALDALTGLGSVASVPRMRKLLDDPDLVIRREAACSLGRFQDGDSVPRLIEMLRDPVHQLRCAAAKALGEGGDPRGAKALLPFLEKPEGDLFDRAVDAVGQLKSVEAAPALLRCARERGNVIDALGDVGAKAAIPDLIRFLEEPGQADNAALALAKLGATEAIPAIRRRIDARNQTEFFDLATALADLGDSSALVEALGSKLDYVRREAARELCLRGDRRGAPELLEHSTFNPIPPELNALRDLELWRELTASPRQARLQGCRMRVLERIAAAAGMEITWGTGKSYEQKTWPRRWESLWWYSPQSNLIDSLALATTNDEHRVFDTEGFAFILDRGVIRMLPHEEALKFWKQWWADEQAKLKK